MAGTHRIHIDVFSAVQLSERPNYGWILAPQEKKFTIIFEWQEYIEYIDVFMQFISLSLKQQNLGEILHPKKKKFTLIFDWQEYIRTHRCLFCSSSHPETTDYRWIFAPQKKTTGKLFAPQKKKKTKKNSPSSSEAETHWIYIDISLQFISLWNNRLQVNSCNIQKMKFTVTFEWQEYISLNLRTITMINK